MSHIFISYSREDIEFTRYIRALLENQGFSVWMDEKRLGAGMDWWDEIEMAIDSSAAFLVIMSPDSRESVFVRNEILRALDQKRPMFPVLYRGKHFGILAHAHYEDMRGGLNATFSDDFLSRLAEVAGLATQRRLRFEIVQASITEVEADVLLLKDAPGAGGLAQMVKSRLKKHGVDIRELIGSATGDYIVTETHGIVQTPHVAFVKTEWIGRFNYREVREFSRRGLAILGHELPESSHIITTIHGVNTRLKLDEGETVLAQVAGIIDAMQAWEAPHKLTTFSIIERHPERVQHLRHTLEEFFEGVHYASRADDSDWAYDLTFERDQRVETPAAGAEEIKPYVVALFPENPELEDIFYYGIQRSVHAMGLLCERLSPESYSEENDSDNLQSILERIKHASALICDLTDASPLLYLLPGFALGRDIPTAFISRDETQSLLDEKPIHYEKIWQLEERLGQWLKNL